MMTNSINKTKLTKAHPKKSTMHLKKNPDFIKSLKGPVVEAGDTIPDGKLRFIMSKTSSLSTEAVVAAEKEVMLKKKSLPGIFIKNATNMTEITRDVHNITQISMIGSIIRRSSTKSMRMSPFGAAASLTTRSRSKTPMLAKRSLARTNHTKKACIRSRSNLAIN